MAFVAFHSDQVEFVSDHERLAPEVAAPPLDEKAHSRVTVQFGQIGENQLVLGIVIDDAAQKTL